MRCLCYRIVWLHTTLRSQLLLPEVTQWTDMIELGYCLRTCDLNWRLDDATANLVIDNGRVFTIDS